MSEIVRKVDGSLTLYFTDENTHDCDILIGNDGIQSIVRKFVLGKNDSAVSPRNTGYWMVMAAKPYAEAQASLGKELMDVDNPLEYGWIGDGAFLFHNVQDP